MDSIQPGTPAQQPPHMRLGGVVTFRGKEYATPGELEQALASAVQDAGTAYTVKLTALGQQLAAQLAAEGEGGDR